MHSNVAYIILYALTSGLRKVKMGQCNPSGSSSYYWRSSSTHD